MNRQKKEIEKERQRKLLEVTPIDSFFGKYRFLSNFYPTVIRVGGMLFQSTEAAYQAFKTTDIELRKTFQGMTASEAKAAGNLLEIRSDWDVIRIPIMRGLVKQKFRHNLMWQSLQATAPRQLVEGNHWHDTFWGVCNGKCKQGPHKPFGSNILGEILMEVRDGKP